MCWKYDMSSTWKKRSDIDSARDCADLCSECRRWIFMRWPSGTNKGNKEPFPSRQPHYLSDLTEIQRLLTTHNLICLILKTWILLRSILTFSYTEQSLKQLKVAIRFFSRVYNESIHFTLAGTTLLVTFFRFKAINEISSRNHTYIILTP